MERMEGSEAVSDSQQQFLQPISKFFPPNELLSKHYAPDEKPILKLMKLEKPQIAINSQLKKRYKTTFESEDTLGYQYNYALNNEMVYLKFNNQNYFKYKIKNRTYKFLAGMFLPVQKILSAEVKASKNIYKTLADIEYSQYKLNIEDSFAKNSKFSNSKTLKFSSNYESGNLFIAMKKKQFEYDLILQNDINSKGNTQWFNFAVEFHQEGTYKFNILNFTKSYSQYEDGMKIVCFSYRDQEMGVGGWNRGCNNIKYEQSSVSREQVQYKYYSCLKFEYVCNYTTDKVIFSYFYPYTSLDLERFLKKVLYRKINVHMKLEKTRICETLSGLPVYAISIQHKKNHIRSDNSTGTSSPNLKNSNMLSSRPNKSVVIMARQHPGETQGSFITEGIIDILMENGELDYMKRSVDFHIFPMVNTDGVLYGNYRTNLAGTDLNRIWRNPKKQLHPQVYYIKKYLHMINKQSPISLIIDLHGHSKSLNSFFYGNPPKKDILTNSIEDSRLFPFVCSKKIKQISFNQSTFNITQDKKNSARVVLSQMFPRAHVYTFQNSFHGWRKDQNTIHEYTPDLLRKIGREIVVTYLEYDKLCEKNPQIKQKWTKQVNQLKAKNDKSFDSEGGSDSEADFQLIEPEDNSQKTPFCQHQGKSIFDSKKDIQSLMRKQNKQNFITRNLLIKTQVYNRTYNRYNRKLISSEDSQSFIKPKRESKQTKNNNEMAVPSQGFLSIVKIKTNNLNSPPGTKASHSDLESLDKYSQMDSKVTKQSIIEKLKRKKIRIQQAVHSSSGMKTFLRTMGIPLEKKIF